MIALSDSQVERFSRQIVLPEIGAARQRALIEGKATVVADSTTLALVSIYLAAAGVGRLAIVPLNAPLGQQRGDGPVLDPLPRLGKGSSGPAGLAALLAEHNPQIAVEVQPEEDWQSAVAQAGVVVAASAPGVAALSRAGRATGTALVWGEAAGAGLAAGADVSGHACWECARTEIRLNRQACQSPLTGSLRALLSAILAVEAIKVLAGLGSALAGVVLLVDCDGWIVGRSETRSRPGCLICGAAGSAG